MYIRGMTPTKLTQWSDRLAFDIALVREGSGEPIKDVLATHGLTKKDMLAFSKDPVFEKRVQEYQDDIKKNGLTFRLKARAQAEELLTTSWLMIHDPDTSPAVRADLIKSTVKWAGLEPTGKDANSGAGGGVTIQINLPTIPHSASTIAAATQPLFIEGVASVVPDFESGDGEAQALPASKSISSEASG